MYSGFSMQIYPTKEQEEKLFLYCKRYHNLYNFLVAKYKDGLPNVSSHSIPGYEYSDIRKEYGYVDFPERVLRGCVQTYVWTVTRCFKHLAKPPRFHKYDPNKQSFYLADLSRKIINHKFIHFPTVGKHTTSNKNILYIDEEFCRKKSITEFKDIRFCYRNGKWFISGCYKIDDVAKSQNKSMLGLDWGLKNFMTTSEGELINYPSSVLREYQRIKRLQSIMDKKQKGSKNRKKVLLKLQKAWKRFENLKKDFIHKSTTKIAKENNISVEKISKNIINKKYTRRNALLYPRQRYLKFLKWKCDKFGSYYIEVDPAYTSQTCSKCGQIHNLSLSDRKMECDCGLVLDRDINAAINIKNRGEEILSQMCTCHTQLSL